jgi:hypothetical protein
VDFVWGNSSKRSFASFIVLFSRSYGSIGGDYRSSGNVSFNTATNWQVWNGSWATQILHQVLIVLAQVVY